MQLTHTHLKPPFGVNEAHCWIFLSETINWMNRLHSDQYLISEMVKTFQVLFRFTFFFPLPFYHFFFKTPLQFSRFPSLSHDSSHLSLLARVQWRVHGASWGSINAWEDCRQPLCKQFLFSCFHFQATDSQQDIHSTQTIWTAVWPLLSRL